MTAFTNETVDLVCELTQNIWIEGVTISRRLRGSAAESDICSVNSSGTDMCNDAKLSSNGTVNPPDTLTVVVSMTAECSDGGQYFCGPSNAPESKASVLLTVFGKCNHLNQSKLGSLLRNY